MTTAIRTRPYFTSIFRSGGDSLWHATDADGKDLYACSDGTPPYDCEHGPYIIQTDDIVANGMKLGPGSSSDTLYGHFQYRHNKDGLCRVRCSLGCSRELARRLGVTKIAISVPITTRYGREDTVEIVGEFK